MFSTRIKNIIFDFAVVLVECPYDEFVKKTFPQLTDQIKVKQLSDIIFKSESWSQYDKGLDYKTLKTKLCGLINSHPDLVACNKTDIDTLISVIKSLMTPIEETVILMEQLRNIGMNIYGLTNMPKEIYDHLLKTYDFFTTFSGIVSSSYTGLAKPEMPIYKRLLSDYNIYPQETIFLDDRQENLVKARELGIKTVLFTNAQQVREILNKQLDFNLDKFYQLGPKSQNSSIKMIQLNQI